MTNSTYLSSNAKTYIFISRTTFDLKRTFYKWSTEKKLLMEN